LEFPTKGIRILANFVPCEGQRQASRCHGPIRGCWSGALGRSSPHATRSNRPVLRLSRGSACPPRPGSRSTAYYSAPLLMALTVVFLGFAAVRKRDAGRLFYGAAGWAVAAISVGFLGLLASAALHCPVRCNSACSGHVRLCVDPSIAASFLPPSVRIGAGKCKCLSLVISPARALIGLS